MLVSLLRIMADNEPEPPLIGDQMVIRHEHIFEWMDKDAYVIHSFERGTNEMTAIKLWKKMLEKDTIRKKKDQNGEVLCGVLVEIREELVGTIVDLTE